MVKLQVQTQVSCTAGRPLLSEPAKKPKLKGFLTHEKILNITHYQRNANQNHNEVPLHTSQDGCYPKVYKQ